jgi:hypothetical protein
MVVVDGWSGCLLLVAAMMVTKCNPGKIVGRAFDSSSKLATCTVAHLLDFVVATVGYVAFELPFSKQ